MYTRITKIKLNSNISKIKLVNHRISDFNKQNSLYLSNNIINIKELRTSVISITFFYNEIT